MKSAFENAEYTDYDEYNLVLRLRKSEDFIPELSLVADQGEEIVGHIMFTKIKEGKHIALTLIPLSVLPKMQSQGICGKLIESGHKNAKEFKLIFGHVKDDRESNLIFRIILDVLSVTDYLWNYVDET